MSEQPKNDRVSAARSATEGRGETFYPGSSRTPLAAYPPRERWDDWVELDARAWPKRKLPAAERENALGVYIHSLRKRLAAIGLRNALQTVRRVGYRLEL